MKNESPSFFLLSSVSLILIAFFCHLESFQTLLYKEASSRAQLSEAIVLHEEEFCEVSETTSKVIDNYMKSTGGEDLLSQVVLRFKQGGQKCSFYPKTIVIEQDVNGALDTSTLISRLRSLEKSMSTSRASIEIYLKGEVPNEAEFG